MQKRHRFQAVSGDDDHSIFLFSLLLLSQALFLVLGGMTGEWCLSSWSVTGSSRRISRAPLSCLPSILPLPIIVNQSGSVSTGEAVHCQGSGVQRAASCTPASHYTSTGPPGALLKRLPGHDATTKTETFCFTTHNAHG